MRQVTAVLRNDNEQRKQFLASGGLKLVQTLGVAGGGGSGSRASAAAAAADPELADLVGDVNQCFPPEVVAYCRPDYMAKLADRIRDEVKSESADERKQWLKDAAERKFA